MGDLISLCWETSVAGSFVAPAVFCEPAGAACAGDKSDDLGGLVRTSGFQRDLESFVAPF